MERIKFLELASPQWEEARKRVKEASLDYPSECLTLRETARVIGVSEKTIYNWINKKGNPYTLPVYRLEGHRKWCVPLNELEEWIKTTRRENESN